MKIRSFLAVLICCYLSLGSVNSYAAPAKKQFNICWTIYAGWMPWDYARAKGIVDKWASKYGISIKVTQFNDYIESVNQYSAGQFDGCTMTNMDALTIPAAGGVDSTALITGSYSNGNDGVVLKGPRKQLQDIKGANVNLVEFSVSHYLLARALESVGLRERDIKIVNTSDADIVGAFASPSVKAMATWNPQLAELLAMPNASKVFDSSQIPGEIIDLMVVNTATLQQNPALGKALTGAWFEVMTAMKANDKEALRHMAAAAGTTLESYSAQLRTTALFYTPASALSFVQDPKLAVTMRKIAHFSFDKGLLGGSASNPDAIGMSFPNGSVVGNPKKIKLRFTDAYLRLAVDGKL